MTEQIKQPAAMSIDELFDAQYDALQNQNEATQFNDDAACRRLSEYIEHVQAEIARRTDCGALQLVAPDEFQLKPEHDGIWLTIQNLSLRVRCNPEGVTVACYPLNDENSDSLDELSVTFAEARAARDTT